MSQTPQEPSNPYGDRPAYEPPAYQQPDYSAPQQAITPAQPTLAAGPPRSSRSVCRRNSAHCSSGRMPVPWRR